MTAPSWSEGLSAAGLYYDGIIDESRLQDILELHKRDTVSTFGTRSSRRVSSEASASRKSKTESSSNTVDSGVSGPDVAAAAASKENINPSNGSPTQEKPQAVGLTIINYVTQIYKKE